MNGKSTKGFEADLLRRMSERRWVTLGWGATLVWCLLMLSPLGRELEVVEEEQESTFTASLLPSRPFSSFMVLLHRFTPEPSCTALCPLASLKTGSRCLSSRPSLLHFRSDCGRPFGEAPEFTENFCPESC